MQQTAVYSELKLTLESGIMAEAVLRFRHADGQFVKAHAGIPERKES